MHTLHQPEAVLSLRHAPTWLLLTAAAGCVNAIALAACQRFVSHVTGNVTYIGWHASQWTLPLEYAVVVGCFVLGSMISVIAVAARAEGRKPLYTLPFLLVAGLLTGVAVAGWGGYFGPFGETVETARDFVLLSALSLAMGIQNAAVASSTANAVRTTHLTGPATDLGVLLATALYTDGMKRKDALMNALLRLGKIVAFAVGAGLAIPLVRAVGYLSLLVPAAAVLIAYLLSYLPFERKRLAEQEKDGEFIRR